VTATRFCDWIEIKKLTTDTGQATTHLVYKDGDEARFPRVLKHMKGEGPFLNRLRRFRAEIEACNRLSHPNIIRLIESGLHKDKPFIVTEYCEGGALSPKTLVGTTLVERLNLFRGVCDGIAYAHSQGVVHRDLKPDNIFLQANGNPVVGDFSLCFLLDGSQERATHANEAVGARWYMAPECEGGRTLMVGPTADVYSLGKVLYWMLAGRIFSREDHSRSPYDLRPNQTTTDMSVVYELFERTIVEDPAARIKDGAEVVRELDSVIHRIRTRRRVFDLANAPGCAANHPEVRVASFRPGSTVTYDLLDTCGFQPKGFVGSGENLALWGVRPLGRHPTEVAIFTPVGAGSWRSLQHKATDSLSLIQSGGHESLAFDSRGQACVVVTEVQKAGQDRKLLLAKASGGNDLTTVYVADGVGSPRHSALAFGPSGEIAIYSGNDQPAKSGANSETIVKAGAALDRYPTHPHSSFSAPLAFDRKGKLHQAIVASISGGTHEVRSLSYIAREPSGEWTQATVDSTAGHGTSGPTLWGG
jgi:serine/threonine protein kinase